MLIYLYTHLPNRFCSYNFKLLIAMDWGMFSFEGEEEGRIFLCGFKFCPTNTEILFCLKNKILLESDPYDLIPTIDVFASSPYNLPLSTFKHGLPDEWFFYSNRRKGKILTDDGYYNLSSRKTILDGKELVGYVRILDFYHGRPPRGTKSRWTVHEYRVNPDTIKVNEDDLIMKEKILNFVICKIVQRKIYRNESEDESNIVLHSSESENSLSDEKESLGDNNFCNEGEYNQYNIMLEKSEGHKSSDNGEQNLESDQKNNDMIISQAADESRKSSLSDDDKEN